MRVAQENLESAVALGFEKEKAGVEVKAR